MNEKLTKQQEAKLDTFLKEKQPKAPPASKTEWHAIQTRIEADTWIASSRVRLLVPVALAAVLAVVLWIGAPSTPTSETRVEAYLLETTASLYQGEIDDAIGEWAYWAAP